MKRWLVGWLCLCLAVAVTGCSRIGTTPFERTESDAPASDSTASDISMSDSSGGESNVSGPAQGNSAVSGGLLPESSGSGDNAAVVDWDDLNPDGDSSAGTTPTTSTTAKPPVTSVPVTTPTVQVSSVLLPAEGFSLDGKMQVASASLSGSVVTLVFHNATSGQESNRENSTCTYVCLDKAGNVLATDRVATGRIRAGQDGQPVTVTLPAGTAEFRITAFDIEWWSDGFR